MTISFASIARGAIWALVGSLLFAVFLFPLGGPGGLAGLGFMINNAVVLFVVGLVLATYPTQRTPFFKRLFGFRGLESTIIFLIIVEASAIGLFVLYWMAGIVSRLMSLWTDTVGVELAAAHFLVSAGVFALAGHRARKAEEPGAWFIAPGLTVVALLLVPLVYRGVLFQ